MNLQFGRLKGGFWAGSASDDTAVYSQRVSERLAKLWEMESSPLVQCTTSKLVGIMANDSIPQALISPPPLNLLPS